MCLSDTLSTWCAAVNLIEGCKMYLSYDNLILTLTHSWFFICPRPGCSSNEEDWPNLPSVSTPVAMATIIFSTFLILISLSFIAILLLSLLPTVTQVLPFSSSSSPSSSAPKLWPSPTCGFGQSWAVRLHTGPYYDKDNGEQVTVEMDVMANRVQNFTSVCIRWWYFVFYEDWWNKRSILDLLSLQVAQLAGLRNQGQIGQLEGHYLLCSVGSETELKDGVWSERVHPGDALATHPHVMWYSQERVLSRSKRSMAFNDPRYPKQWHLVSSYTIAMFVYY